MTEPGEKTFNTEELAIQSKLREAVPAAYPTLRTFIESNDEISRIDGQLSAGDLQILTGVSYETQVIKNQYGTFAWKGTEADVKTPPIIGSQEVLLRAMLRSKISLDLHSHITSVFTNDRSYPGPVDLSDPRVHDIAVATKDGISLTSPLLYEPGKKGTKILHRVQLMYGTFLRGQYSDYNSQYYDGDDWKRFIEAAGGNFLFLPWDDPEAIEATVLNQPQKDYASWMNSDDPFERALAFRLFSSTYNFRDYMAKPELFHELEKFITDKNPALQKEALEESEGIKSNIEYARSEAKS